VHHVVELFFDPTTEAAVRALWHALAEAGIDGVPGGRPHVSLAVYGQLDVERFRSALTAFAAGRAPLETTLASWGVFPGAEAVVFLAPVVTREMLALQEDFLARFAEFGAPPHYYGPGAWVPHCTLAAGLPPSELPRVAGLCHRLVRPIGGRLERIGLVEYIPRREHVTLPFGS
jgi:2'-5' RNA ligase